MNSLLVENYTFLFHFTTNTGDVSEISFKIKPHQHVRICPQYILVPFRR